MRKFTYVVAAVLCTALISTSCKPKESAYKKAYEKAKAEELANQNQASTPVALVSDAPVVVRQTTPPATDPVVRSEQVVAQDGATLKMYNVVAGSYGVKSNSDAEVARLKSLGYPAIQAYSPSIRMYRVIVDTFDSRQDAANARDAFKAKYPNNTTYQGAWLLTPQQ